MMDWFVFLVVISFVGCEADSLKEVVDANAKFTESVYKNLIKTQNDNLIFSGLSAEIVLSLLADGAKDDTQSQLLTALNLPQSQTTRDAAFQQITTNLDINSENLKLLSANKIYPAEGFPISKAFNKTAVDIYHSDVQNLNYANPQQAANIIDEWVEDHTNNKIKNLIDPSQLSKSTVLVLVNALYFSGDWIHAFEKYNTRERLFYTSETKSKNIEMMSTVTNARYLESSNLKAKFLELDFQNGSVSMVFVLPNCKTGLTAVENNLEKYFEPQQMKNVRVEITLPKFTLNTKIDFTPILQQLGATKVFTDQANLTGISSKGKLKVSFIVQKAFINVTETGVEAAAATAVGISLTSVHLPPESIYSFNVDHPFLFYIRDKKSGIILFAGRFLKF